MFIRSKYICLLSLVLCCAGCVKSPFARPRILKPLTKETAHDVRTKEQVTVYAKKLNNADQQEMFGEYAIDLNKLSIVPVQLTVENRSQLNWVLSNKNIDLNTLSMDQVNKKFFESRRMRPTWIFLGCIGAGIALGGLMALSFGSSSHFWLVLCGGAILGTSAGFVIGSAVAIVDALSYQSSKSEMRCYLKRRCNAEGITVEPDITASMLFFANESEIPEKLNIVLTHTDSSETLPFELAL